MAKLFKITGMTQVLANMKKSTVVLGKQMETGLKKGGLFLQRESMKIVPVDLNNLRPSARTDNVGGSGLSADIVVHYGAGADYAVYVHEDMDAKHKPGKTAKYLERPALEKKNEIFNIIAKG
jgi:hypothetical protein